VLPSPPQAPRANAYAERWIGMLRREGLDRRLIFGERQLRAVLAEYEGHYNGHRPNRCLDQRAPLAHPALTARTDSVDIAVKRRKVLGGLITNTGAWPEHRY
jgi:putative transposase